MQKALRIEIYKTRTKSNSWVLREGDVSGSSEHYNISKDEVLALIKDCIEEIENGK